MVLGTIIAGVAAGVVAVGGAVISHNWRDVEKMRIDYAKTTGTSYQPEGFLGGLGSGLGDMLPMLLLMIPMFMMNRKSSAPQVTVINAEEEAIT